MGNIQHSLKGTKLEALPHLEGVEAALIPHAELLQAPLDELHGKAARVNLCAGVQSRKHLDTKNRTSGTPMLHAVTGA